MSGNRRHISVRPVSYDANNNPVTDSSGNPAANVVVNSGVTTPTALTYTTQPYTGTGVNDNDVLFTTNDVQNLNTHYVHCDTATCDVEATIDGTNWFLIAGQDMAATAPATYVVEVAVGVTVRFKGRYKQVRALQKGAAAATATYVGVWEVMDNAG